MGIRPSIYPTYRIAIPLCIAAVPPLYSPYSIVLPSYPALFGDPAVVTIANPVAWVQAVDRVPISWLVATVRMVRSGLTKVRSELQADSVFGVWLEVR